MLVEYVIIPRHMIFLCVSIMPVSSNVR